MGCYVKSVLGISFLLIYLTYSKSEFLARLNADSMEDEGFVCDCLKAIESVESDTTQPMYCSDNRNLNSVRKAK